MVLAQFDVGSSSFAIYFAKGKIWWTEEYRVAIFENDTLSVSLLSTPPVVIIVGILLFPSKPGTS